LFDELRSFDVTKPTLIGFQLSGGKTDRVKCAARRSDADAWERFGAEVQKGVDSAERDELYDADEVFAEVKARLQAAIAKKRG
jgi:hypothetical protein